MDKKGSLLEPEEKVGSSVAGKTVSTKEAAEMLGVSEREVKTLVSQELLKETAPGSFDYSDVAQVATKRGLSLAEEATQVGIGLQRTLAATLNVIRVIVTTAFAGAVVYGLTVAGFVVAYSYYPTQVAGWISQKNPTPLQAILQSPGDVALGILRYAEPTAYKEVSEQIIVNPNDIFTVGKFGSLTPTGAIVIPRSSYLSISTKDLITNLNSQYVQGRIPGTTTGNLAIVGQISLSDDSVTTSVIKDGEVKNADLAQITDSNKVAGSAVQLSSGGGLANDSGITLLKTCADSEILKWNDTAGTWGCEADQGTAGSGVTSIREGGVTTVSSAIAINFGANDFAVAESPATVGSITIDYTNSKIVRSDQSETITGAWTFPSGTVLGTQTFATNSITDFGALSISTTTNSALTLDSGTVGAVNLGTGANSKTITVGNSTGTTALNLTSGSGGIGITGAVTFNTSPLVLGAASSIIDMTGSGILGINTTTNRAITTGTGIFTTGGALTATGALTSSSSLSASGNLSLPKGTDFATTGTQNNVNLGDGAFFKYTGVASATFTGIAGGANGRILTLANASSANLTLNYLNGGSSASNQIVTPSGGDLVIGPKDAVSLQYDSGSSLWRVVNFTPSTNSLSGTTYVNGGNSFGATASLGTNDAFGLNILTSGSTRFSLAAGSATLTGTGATTFTTSSGSALTLESGTTGGINIGTDADNESISIGTGAGIKTLTLGSATTSSSTVSHPVPAEFLWVMPPSPKQLISGGFRQVLRIR